MKLKTIEVNNFHGQNLAVELGDVNIITGKNFRGKTAIMKSARLGLTGYLPPPIGKAAGSIYKLAGNPEASGELLIELTTDNGRKARSVWRKDDRGRVSFEGGCPVDMVMPALLCEPRLFFGMTGPDQVRTLFGACSVDGTAFGPEQLKTRLVEVQESPVAICEETLSEVVKQAELYHSQAQTVQEFCDKLIAGVKSAQKVAKDAKDTAQGAFAAFRVKLSSGPAPKDQSAAIATLEAEIAKAGTDDAGERQRLWSKIEALKNHFTDDYAIVGGFETAVSERIALIQKNNKEAAAELNNLTRQDDIDVKVLAEKIQALNNEEIPLANEGLECDSIVKAQTALLATVKSLKLCAKCSAKLTGEAEGLSAEKNARLAVIRVRLAEIQKQRSALSTEHSVGVEINKRRNDRITALEIIIEDSEKVVAGLKARLSEYTDLTGKFSKLGEPVAEDPRKAKLTELRQIQTQYEQHRADISRRDTLEQELLKHQCREAVFKAVAKIIVEEQGKLMALVFGDVLKVARNFTDDLINSPLEFYNGELGRRVVEADESLAPIGSWISHECFSGTESLLAYAGFSVALAQKAPMKIVFMDEMNNVHPELLRKIIVRMEQLVDGGVIDQFIGIAPTLDQVAINSKGLTVISI